MLMNTIYANSLEEINQIKKYAEKKGLIVFIDDSYTGDATRIGLYWPLTKAEEEFYNIK